MKPSSSTKAVEHASRDPIQDFVDAVNSQQPVAGFTHSFYRYPARFSPLFARAAIEAFSEPGDTVLDPFMGGATTLVEALTLGRNAVGSDISSLATFLARLKTTTLSENDLTDVIDWASRLPKYLDLHEPPKLALEWREAGYQRNVPWRHRKTIEFVLHRIPQLRRARQRRFARGILLKLSQWALDCREHVPPIPRFREELSAYLDLCVTGMRDFRTAVFANRLPDKTKPTALCLQRSATELPKLRRLATREARPTLVVTSPPYPGVYVLYHRWKVRGRKETPAPFWLAGCRDGNGQAHYSFGDRRCIGLKEYFEGIKQSFTGVRQIIDPDALVIQMVAFSEPRWQVAAYLKSMHDAGFAEVMPSELGIPITRRLWRKVPGRHWFALIHGDLGTSREVVLFHRLT